MLNMPKDAHTLPALAALVILSVTTCAAVPGPAYSPRSEAGDAKIGSLLIYNIYSSSAVNAAIENTRLTITNTHQTAPTSIHLFFVDGTTCNVSDSFLCLAKRQTVSLLASDFDPGATGYLIVLAIDGATGAPHSFNYLAGEESVKFSGGHHAHLGAVAFSALYNGILPGYNNQSSTATIAFNGTTGYSSLPQMLALDNISDRPSGNKTMVIINRISGDLILGHADTIGQVCGLLYDENAIAYSFSATAGSCQFISSLTNNFPRTTPKFESLISAGRTGWMKLWSPSGAGLLGAMITFNPDAETKEEAFSGGHNLRHLTLAPGSGDAAHSYTVPVIPPTCH